MRVNDSVFAVLLAILVIGAVFYLLGIAGGIVAIAVAAVVLYFLNRRP